MMMMMMKTRASVFLSRLYERHGEAAVRSFSQFHPTVTPADVMAMAERSHFLAYLDNLVQAQAEEHRCIVASLSKPTGFRVHPCCFSLLQSGLCILQVGVPAVAPGSRVPEAGLAPAGSYPRCSSVVWHNDARWTTAVWLSQRVNNSKYAIDR